MYLFVALTVVIIAIGTIISSYMISAAQIDRIFKQITIANAKNFAATLDGDYLRQLRTALETDEYQAIHDRAEAEDNEQLVQDYLEEQGLWDEYTKIRDNIDMYIRNTECVKYLYIVANGDANATTDMFMIDDSNETLYDSAGRWEDREAEYIGSELWNIEPTIAYSEEWGWLCSDFAPVYDSNEEVVCIVGCDIEYEDIATAKFQYLLYDILVVFIIAVFMIVIAFFAVSKLVVDPLNNITENVLLFKPTANIKDANVIELDIKRNDEIGAIYHAIRQMEMSIIDHLHSITQMQNNIAWKDNQITQLNTEMLRDELTGVGNRLAYSRKLADLKSDYAIVMVDLNNLKEINDIHGHDVGDGYIKDCCHVVCDVFKHSAVYRIGGDEFTVVIDGDDYKDKEKKFRELIDAFNTIYEDKSKKPWERLSASCGIATYEFGDSPEDVVDRADKKMYKYKAAFRAKYGSYR